MSEMATVGRMSAAAGTAEMGAATKAAPETNTVTPPKKVGGLEKGMLEELLLVCTFVGTKRAAGDNNAQTL